MLNSAYPIGKWPAEHSNDVKELDRDVMQYCVYRDSDRFIFLRACLKNEVNGAEGHLLAEYLQGCLYPNIPMVGNPID